ncbi:hypothetical protein [Breoghania sp.]|uniref:hypothetical protein n=1 Tax=Breoghania sp. TaxID=2065378 RepID=UPI002608D2AE|nr:hypothetical protein [Breoghania sp.]MDJ0929799.1 hypothetical protein [Breoghania sp.]
MATVTGSAPEGRPQAQAKLDATFRGQPLSATAKLETADDGTRRLNDISVVAANTRLQGHLTLGANGKPSGEINLYAPILRRSRRLFCRISPGL